MAPDDPASFDHDETTFERASVVGNLVLVSGELEYAELFSEVIWDGLITSYERERLDRAAGVFGLDPGRAATIEAALRASFEAAHRVAVREEAPPLEMMRERTQTRTDFLPALTAPTPSEPPAAAETAPARRSVPPPREPGMVAPLDFTRDPIVAALDRRVAALEEERDRILAERDRLAGRVAELEAELDLARRASIDVELSFTSGGSAIDRDPDAIHERLAAEPTDLGLVIALFSALKREADADRRMNVAGVAVALAARNGEDLPSEITAAWQSRPAQALIRPTRALGAAAWSLLGAGDHVDARAVLAEVTPAAIIVRMGSRPRGSGDALGAATRVEPRGSTVQAVRCVAWAAAILGMEVPPIHVDRARPGFVDLVLVPPLATVLGQNALSGASAAELAFFAGRHLTLHRPEHVLVGLGSPTRDLEDVFLAGLLLGDATLPLMPDVRRRAEPLARALQPLLDTAALARLRQAFVRFVERGGRAHLGRWTTAVHQTAARAGLLLCDDPRVAFSSIDRIDAQRSRDLVADLVVFATSSAYSDLRRQIGVAL